jgi:hypothetical protein
VRPPNRASACPTRPLLRSVVSVTQLDPAAVTAFDEHWSRAMAQARDDDRLTPPRTSVGDGDVPVAYTGTVVSDRSKASPPRTW